MWNVSDTHPAWVSAVTLICPNTASDATSMGIGQRRQQDQLVEQHVAEPDGADHPGVRAEQARRRRQVVAVLAQEGDGILHRRTLHRLARRRQAARRLDHVAVAVVLDEAVEPRADVAAARHGGQVVHAPQQVVFGQPLQDAEIERRRSDAAAREREAERLHPMGLRRGAPGVVGLQPLLVVLVLLVVEEHACATPSQPLQLLGVDGLEHDAGVIAGSLAKSDRSCHSSPGPDTWNVGCEFRRTGMSLRGGSGSQRAQTWPASKTHAMAESGRLSRMSRHGVGLDREGHETAAGAGRRVQTAPRGRRAAADAGPGGGARRVAPQVAGDGRPHARRHEDDGGGADAFPAGGLGHRRGESTRRAIEGSSRGDRADGATRGGRRRDGVYNRRGARHSEARRRGRARAAQGRRSCSSRRAAASSVTGPSSRRQ